MRKITPLIITSFVLLLSLACSTIEIGAGSLPADSNTPLPPEEPTAVPTEIPTVEPPRQLIQVTGDTVKFALIALEDNGASGDLIGCGDSVVMADVHYDPSYDPLKIAFMGLLNVGEKYYGQSGLYNALYPSSLMIESLTYEGGTVFIHLTGTLMVGGTCDIPRIEAQFMKTALQFPELSGAQIFINGTPLAELLSLK
jgi:hypothetical protein